MKVGVSQNWGHLFGSYYNKDYSRLGSALGSSILGNYQVSPSATNKSSREKLGCRHRNTLAPTAALYTCLGVEGLGFTCKDLIVVQYTVVVYMFSMLTYRDLMVVPK